MDRDDYVKTIKSAFVTISTNGILGVLVAKVPFFSNSILKKLAKFFIEKGVKIIVDLAENQAFFHYIDMRTGEQAKEFEEAANKNREAQENGSEKEKAEAEALLIDKFRVFAKFSS